MTWSADGRSIHFSNQDPDTSEDLMVLPETPDRDSPLLGDVTADGQRFLLNVPTTSRSSVQFHAILNWTSNLKGTRAREGRVLWH